MNVVRGGYPNFDLAIEDMRRRRLSRRLRYLCTEILANLERETRRRAG